MRKVILLLMTLVASSYASAYEYVFDMSKALETGQIYDQNKWVIESEVNPISGKKAKMTLILTNKEFIDKMHISEEGQLVFYGQSTKIQIASQDGFAPRATWLGTISGKNLDDVYFGDEVNGVKDWKGADIGGRTNFFIKEKGGTFTKTSFYSKPVPDYVRQEIQMGPKVYFWTEGTSLEDLTFADHNVKQQYHAFDHDLVGVKVVPVNGKKVLLARSADPISAAHKHGLQPGQQLWRDANGKVPAWANPETPQYAWIALEISNPDDYVGKQIRNVRGIYVNGNDLSMHHVHWYNPIMEVKDKVEVIAENVPTTINTYSIANMSEQDKSKYFFMEPRLYEVCNIVDVMRTSDQAMYVPTVNALFPEGKGNPYHKTGVAGSGMIAGFNGQFGDFGSMWREVDKRYNYESWRTYNKVFNVKNAIILAFDQDQYTKTGYYYPLDTPNFTYDEEGSGKISMAIFGSSDTEISIDDYTDDDFAVADVDYFSRYNYTKEYNAYKNDLHIMINNTKIDLSGINDLKVTRRNGKGEVLATIATLKCQGDGKYKVIYDKDSQSALGNDLLKTNTTEYLGDNNFLNPDMVYDLKDVTSPIIYISDLFIGDDLSTSDANASQNVVYQYRIEPAENTKKEITCVINAVPVFKTDENVVSRATYTLDDVKSDIDGHLTEVKDVAVNFTPNQAHLVTEYRVLSEAKHEDDYEAKAASETLEVGENNFLTMPMKVSAESNNYVPEAYTEYNDNTYGCYKQNVSNSSVSIAENASDKGTTRQESKMAVKQDDVYYKYYHVDLDLASIIENIDKDDRYLIRVWRTQDGEKTLLNDLEIDDPNIRDNGGTNYEVLNSLRRDEKSLSLVLKDTFKAKVNPKSNNGKSPAPARVKAEVVEIENEPINNTQYDVTLYVQDKATKMFYVKKADVTVNWESTPGHEVITAIDDVDAQAQVKSVRYVNATGMMSDHPFDGINVVVTTYSDGRVATSKLII